MNNLSGMKGKSARKILSTDKKEMITAKLTGRRLLSGCNSEICDTKVDRSRAQCRAQHSYEVERHSLRAHT